MSAALVICTGGGIGDVLLATPVVRALHAQYGEVVALTAPAHRDVLARHPQLSDVWVDGLPFAAQAARIAQHDFAVSVTTWASLRSAALPYVARIPMRAGQARRLYSTLFTHRVVVRSELGDRATHWTQILLDFVRAIGCDVADATPDFHVSPEARNALALTLDRLGVRAPYLVLHPTRGIVAARERWPLAGLAGLARALRVEFGATVLVTGGGADAAVADSVAAAGHCVSLGGLTSLAEFGALARGALAVVAMDSGPMHLAAAVGAPTVGIFALQSDEPDRWAPLGPRTAVVRATYPCPAAHRKETCPDFACVAALDIPRILAATGGLLAREAETRDDGSPR